MWDRQTFEFVFTGTLIKGKTFLSFVKISMQKKNKLENRTKTHKVNTRTCSQRQITTEVVDQWWRMKR